MKLSQPYSFKLKRMKSIAFFPGVSNIYMLFIRRIPVLADQYTADRGVNSERQMLLNSGGWLKEGEGSFHIFLPTDGSRFPILKYRYFYSRNGRSQMQMVKG